MNIKLLAQFLAYEEHSKSVAIIYIRIWNLFLAFEASSPTRRRYVFDLFLGRFCYICLLKYVTFIIMPSLIPKCFVLVFNEGQICNNNIKIR